MSEGTSRSSMPTDSDGRGRLKIGAEWRIVAASATIGLLMCGALVLTVHSRGTAVRASVTSSEKHADALASERAVSAFWQERESMGEFLVSPLQRLAKEVRAKRLRFGLALAGIGGESPAERALVERARAANLELIAVFNALPPRSGGVADAPGERRLRTAELSVLAPIAQLTAFDRREYLQAEAVATSAEQAGFHSDLAASLLGLAAIVSFAIFVVRLLRRIENQNVELQLADVAKDEFISTISHELRTPLTSMNGFVELLLDESDDPLTEQQRSFLATVRRGSIRLERLVNDLLLVAQLRAGKLDIRKTNADAVEVARQSVEAAQAHAGQQAVQLSLTAPPHPILIEADVVRLAQAIDNVLSNAIKFTPEGGCVDVTLAENGDRVTVTVADTGTGMTAADIDRLFERFFRTDSAQANHIQGTGLGLPIVKAIVEAHGGTIAITSEPNIGTSFGISLPLAHPLGRQFAATTTPHERSLAA